MSDLLEIAEKILSRADGGEQMEVFVSSGTETEVRAYKGEIENLATAVSSGVGVRVLRDGPGGARIGSAWSGSLDDDAVDEVLREARGNLNFASEDEYVTLAKPDGVRAVPLELVDDGVELTPIDDKVALAIELEKRVRSSDARIRQVDSADYSDYIARGAIVSTSGISATYGRTGAFLSVEAIAADGDGDYTGYGVSVARGPGGVSLDEAAHDAIEMATHMLGARKPSSSKGVVIFDPRTASTVLAIIGSALSGEAVVKGRSFFADRVGEDVATASFTLIDDPTDPRHLGAGIYDGEGLACRRNVLIDKGRLLGFVYDTVSARRAGTVSTGSAARGGVGGSPVASCRALQLAPGSLDQAAILRAIGTGVFVESLTGVHSGVNPISGDFSVGITGRMVRDGQFAEPIKEATVASTLQRMLQDIVHVGGDVKWLPGVAAGQTVAIDGLSLSGS